MNSKIRPGTAVLFIVVVLGVVFGIMWYQSEAPRINRLPHPMAMGAPARATNPALTDKPKPPSPKDSPHKTAAPSAADAKSEAK